MTSLSKYKINRLEDADLKPEETLADVVSEHPSLEAPISRGVFNSFYLVVGLALIFFVTEAARMQLINGKRYAALADRASVFDYPLSALRGIIYDTDDQPLVENVPAFDLITLHSALPKSQPDLDHEIAEISDITGIDSQILIQLFKDNNKNASFAIKRGISKDEILKIKSRSLPGLYVVADSMRHYLDGLAAGHLLGYTAPVTADDVKKDIYYQPTDRIGRLGVEAQYEELLRGEHRLISLKDQDRPVVEALGGHNIYLNIDRKIQSQLYKSLTSVFASAGVRRGAAVIQNPETGAVLGLVSMPSFDSNVFENLSDSASYHSPGGDMINKISKLLASADHPLLNRVIGGRYSPGSTIKPLLAMAGLKEGVVTPTTTIYANGSINVQSEVDPKVTYTFRDWKVHGLTDLKKAIADSVDVYFYILGGGYGNVHGLGIDRIAKYIKSMGADKPTGIDLPGETTGFVPTKEWKQETKGEGWYIGDTYNISIGQGDLQVTPIWLNTYIGSIANGGRLMKPQILREVRDHDGNIISRAAPKAIGQAPFDSQTIDVVRQGMRQTVLTGTAKLLQDVPVALAAKTGTAQVTGRGLNSLFTVWGPYDNPDIVMTVLVENINQSQGLAIKVANDFLLWYYGQYKKQ